MCVHVYSQVPICCSFCPIAKNAFLQFCTYIYYLNWPIIIISGLQVNFSGMHAYLYFDVSTCYSFGNIVFKKIHVLRKFRGAFLGHWTHFRWKHRLTWNCNYYICKYSMWSSPYLLCFWPYSQKCTLCSKCKMHLILTLLKLGWLT